jgi:hypothetical protein
VIAEVLSRRMRPSPIPQCFNRRCRGCFSAFVAGLVGVYYESFTPSAFAIVAVVLSPFDIAGGPT